MPGYIIHLSTAERILQLCNIEDKKYSNSFLLGNIAPDLKQGDEKAVSHFWDEDTCKRFVRKPGLTRFLAKYKGRMHEPFVFGYYCHLYLDLAFLDSYWEKHFAFYDENGEETEGFQQVSKVLLRDTNTFYDRWDFFSEEKFYGDYTRMNRPFIKDYIRILPDVEEINGIDEIDLYQENERLLSMIDFLQKEKTESMRKGKKDEKTRVLVLQDMKSLVEEVAQELSMLYLKGIEKI